MEPAVEELVQFAREELTLRREQGCDTWEWERLLALFRQDPGPDPAKRIRGLIRNIEALQPDEDYPYAEPDDLPRIHGSRPDGPRSLARGLPEEALADAIVGAWTGFVAGCMTGKPVRHWHRVRVDGLLRVCGATGLDGYVPEPPKGRGFDFPDSMRPLLRGHVQGALQDGVTDAAVNNLCLLERRGGALTPRHVAECWLGNVPYGSTACAEQAAYRNAVNGAWPPESAVLRNSFREWTGAMGRAGFWGWALPAQPEAAAELAWRDAQFSHVRNGRYAAMWAAAMSAAAFVASDAEQALRIGLSEIPNGCRLAEAIGVLLEWRAEGVDADEALERALNRCSAYSPMHSIVNASITALALLWGEGDFARTVSLAVTSGFDTSANAALVGAVAGTMCGADELPAAWTEPLRDVVATALPGEGSVRITRLAERTAAVRQRLQQYNGVSS